MTCLLTTTDWLQIIIIDLVNGYRFIILQPTRIMAPQGYIIEVIFYQHINLINNFLLYFQYPNPWPNRNTWAVITVTETRNLESHDIRCYASKVNPEAYRSTHILEGTECAWKLWLDLKPGMRVLDLGCGYGARSVSLAHHGVWIVAVDIDPVKVIITRNRLSILEPSEIGQYSVFRVAHLDRLPLVDACADIVLLPADLTDGHDLFGFSDSDLSAEVNRLLVPAGQVLLTGTNRWALDRLVTQARYLRAIPRLICGDLEHAKTGLATRAKLCDSSFVKPRSLFGYRRFMRCCGVEPTCSLALNRDPSGNLSSIHKFGQGTSSAKSTGFKGRLRGMDFLAPEFGLIGQRKNGRVTYLIDRILRAVAAELSPYISATAFLRVERLHLSRKDKLVLEAVIEEVPVIVRLALSPGSRSAEQHGCALLEHLNQTCLGKRWFPRVLAKGEMNGVYFIAEERISGRALKDTDAVHGERCLQIASRMLERMNPELSASAPVPLLGELYERLVTQPLDKVGVVIEDRKNYEQLRAFLHDRLYGLPIGIGITHGDFSVSNLLVGGDGDTTLIDWEDGCREGLPILDAFTFLSSRRRALSETPSAAGGKRSLPLAAGPRDAIEEKYLHEQYTRCLTNREAHLALTCLRWLNMASSLLAFSFMQRPDNLRFYVHDTLNDYINMLHN